MIEELDELITQLKPDAYFIDEYLTLKYGSKSQYNYHYDWQVIDAKSNYFKTMHGEDFAKKYAGNVYVRLERGPYTQNSVAKDTVELVFTNDYRMKKLYQNGKIGEVDVVYDESDAALQELYNRPILEWSNNVRRT